MTINTRLEDHDGMPVIVADAPLAPMTVERFRELLERVRDRGLHCQRDHCPVGRVAAPTSCMLAP